MQAVLVRPPVLMDPKEHGLFPRRANYASFDGSCQGYDYIYFNARSQGSASSTNITISRSYKYIDKLVHVSREILQSLIFGHSKRGTFAIRP